MTLFLVFLSNSFIRVINTFSCIRDLLKPQSNEGAVIQLTISFVIYSVLAHYVFIYLSFNILPKLLLISMGFFTFLMLNSIQFLGGF